MNEMLEMTRGDTFRFKFQRKTENKEVIFEKVDKMYITIKRNQDTKKALIQKTLDNGITYDESTGYYHVTIEPKDTETLSYGNHYFDIEISKDNVVKTIVKGTINFTKEVTFGCNKEVNHD